MRYCIEIPKFNGEIDSILDLIPKTWGIGLAYNLNISVQYFVQKAIQQGFKFFRIHLSKYETHFYGNPDFTEIFENILPYKNIIEAMPDVEIQFSPFWEHNLNNPDKYLDKISNKFPGLTLINNPKEGALSEKYKNEVHGNQSTLGRDTFYILNYSSDGIAERDILTKKVSCKDNYIENFFIADSQNSNRTVQRSYATIKRLVEILESPAPQIANNEYAQMYTQMSQERMYLQQSINAQTLVGNHAQAQNYEMQLYELEHRERQEQAVSITELARNNNWTIYSNNTYPPNFRGIYLNTDEEDGGI